jgi:hypothetical protein
MMKVWKITALGLAGLSLAACGGGEGTQAYSGPESIIATGQDQGGDAGVLENGGAAIAYDPDGCQNWIIDDGVEGYSTPRYNPQTGLPVCDTRYPPGTVLGNYETTTEGIEDRVSGPGIRTVVNQ